MSIELIKERKRETINGGLDFENKRKQKLWVMKNSSFNILVLGISYQIWCQGEKKKSQYIQIKLYSSTERDGIK